MMKTFLKNFGLAVTVCFIAGCATPSADSVQTGPVATCYVCKYNNDLACVNLDIKDSTPRTEKQGKTYYFCSQDCRDAFLKNPQKYLPKAKL